MDTPALHSADLHKPLLWSLALHAIMLLALGLSSFTPLDTPKPRVLTIELQPARPSPQSAPAPAPAIAKAQPAAAAPKAVSTPLPIVATAATLALPATSAAAPTSIASAQVMENPALQKPAELMDAPALAKATSAITQNETIREEPPQFDADYLHNPQPAYPLFARKRQQQGIVWLKVKVSVDGKADIVELNESSGSSLLDKAALHAVEKWRFVPAHRGKEAVSGWVIVPVQFKLG